MAILKIVRGWPGSGKSSFANRQWPNILHLENDMFCECDGQYQWSKERVKTAINLCTSIVDMALKNDCDVVVANTFTKKRYIAAYEKIALAHGAKFEVYRCVGHFKNVHGLSDEMVEKFEKAMEDWPGETVVDPNEKLKKKMQCEW